MPGMTPLGPERRLCLVVSLGAPPCAACGDANQEPVEAAGPAQSAGGEGDSFRHPEPLGWRRRRLRLCVGFVFYSVLGNR